MPEADDSRVLQSLDDTRWMTYAQLGQARGINAASAKRLAFRRKWRRQAGNDGTARVAVPVDEAARRTGRTDQDADAFDRLVSGLEAALATLREQLERERGRADQAVEAAARDALRLEEAESRIAKLGAAADTAALVRDALETALTAEERARRRAEAEAAAEHEARAGAEAEAAALRQADQVRRELGRVARLRAAWRDGASEGR
jgi:predicted  nucleic acid-binding Zn-ribbon protein